MNKMLEKDPEKRPDIKQLFEDKIVIKSIQKLFEILDKETAIEVFEKSIEAQKIIKPENIRTGLFAASKCLNIKEIEILLYYLKHKKVYEAVLEYRGTEHGWGYKDFHLRADNKDWTVSLFKIKNGDCIGGFTTQSWHHRGYFDCEVRDGNACLFNLSCNLFFPSQNSGKDIICYQNEGPVFGGGGCRELAPLDTPFNGEDKCIS